MENPDNVESEPSTEPNRKERQNLLFAILSLLVCLTIPLSALAASFASKESFGKVNDFPEYYSAAKMICTGNGAAIYKLDELFAVQHQFFPNMEGRGIGYYIPPFSTPMLAGLGILPPEPSFAIYMILSVLSLVAGVILLGKHFRLSKSATIWVATIICASAPAFESLKIAQLAPFLFLSLAGFLYFAGRGKDLLAGLCLSVLLLKPQELMPLVFYLLLALRFKIVGAVFGVGLLSAIVSLMMLQTDGYHNYFELLKNSAANTQFMQPELGATVRGQLLRLIPNDLANAISAGFLVCVTAMIAVVGYKFGRSADFERGLLAVALPLGLVSALHCHDYDLLLLTPWVLALLGTQASSLLPESSARSVARLCACALLLCLAIPIYVPIHYNWLLRDKQALNPIFLLLFSAAAASSIAFIQSRRKVPAADP